MAGSLIGGLIAEGHSKSALKVSEPDAARREALTRQFGIMTVTENADLAANSDMVVLAVKPQVLRPVCEQLARAVQKRRPLILSIAAGIRAADIDEWLGGGLPVIRAMPNTPALLRAGATGLFANPSVSASERNLAEAVMSSVGDALWLTDETQMDLVTGLSGSGPAYFFLILEALEQVAVDAGLSPDIARRLAGQTALGAAQMVLEGGEDPAILRQNVTSPGGTTEQGLRVLHREGVQRAMREAVLAATDRARELAELFAKD